MISQIERGEASPTLAVTLRMACGFGLSLSELVEETGRTTFDGTPMCKFEPYLRSKGKRISRSTK